MDSIKLRGWIRRLQPYLDSDRDHDRADRILWTGLNRVYCPPLAMAVYYWPKVFSLWPAPFHDWLLRQYMTGRHCAIAGPRGFAKSKVWQAYQLYKMLTLDWIYSLHICLSPELVMEHASALIEQLETNKRLQEDFNITPGKVQQQEHFEVQVGKRHKTKLTFEWMTRDGRSRGLHPNGIGIDDIDDRDDTPYVMDKYYRKIHGTIMGALQGFEGVPPQIIVSGNMTGQHCSMHKFQTIDAELNPDQWVVVSIPSLEKGDTSHITGARVGESTWPDKETTEELKALRRVMNVDRAFSFEMEKQNEFVDVGLVIWTGDMFERRWTELPGKHQAVYRVYIDSSQVVREAGDEWGIVTVGKVLRGPRKGEYPLVRGRLSQLSPDDAASEVIEQFVGNGSAANPQCDMVCMESRTKKGEDPFLSLVKMKARQENVNIPVRQLVPGGRDKRQRSLQAAPVGRSGALTVPANPGPDLLRIIEQMKTFTGRSDPNMHAIDDGHDAVVWGLIDLQEVVSPETSRGRFLQRIKVRGRMKGVA